MQKNSIRLFCLLVCLAIALPVLALQRGNDPLTGTWTGDWGPSAEDRNTVSVDLKWDGKALSGVVHSINPQKADVKLQKATFDPNSGRIHMEAEPISTRSGSVVHFVIDGKLTKGSMSGSWDHGGPGKKGDFKLTKK